jgi:hypothetical protein
MRATQKLKNELAAEFPGYKFSVQATRKNGWIGQLIEVKFSHLDGAHVNSICEVFQINNPGYTVYSYKINN